MFFVRVRVRVGVGLRFAFCILGFSFTEKIHAASFSMWCVCVCELMLYLVRVRAGVEVGAPFVGEVIDEQHGEEEEAHQLDRAGHTVDDVIPHALEDLVGVVVIGIPQFSRQVIARYSTQLWLNSLGVRA